MPDHAQKQIWHLGWHSAMADNSETALVCPVLGKNDDDNAWRHQSPVGQAKMQLFKLQVMSKLLVPANGSTGSVGLDTSWRGRDWNVSICLYAHDIDYDGTAVAPADIRKGRQLGGWHQPRFPAFGPATYELEDIVDPNQYIYALGEWEDVDMYNEGTADALVGYAMAVQFVLSAAILHG